MSAYLFVYGTLQRGQPNHHLLADQTSVGAAATVLKYRLVPLGRYRALIESEPGEAVRGELWLVNADRLRELDHFEGVQEGLYTRHPVKLQPPYDDLPVQAYFRGRGHG